MKDLLAVLADPADARVPELLRGPLLGLGQVLGDLERRIETLEGQIVAWGRGNATYRHLITVPGYGPILAGAFAAFVVEPSTFRSGRDFSASLGLVPRQEGTGGKLRLGSISKRGNGAACWSTAPCRSSIPAEPARTRGSPGCSPASRASSWRWPWPTSWHGSAGP